MNFRWTGCPMRTRSIDDLLARFPKHRPPLTPAHERVYVEEYRRNRGGGGALFKVIQDLESWMHRRVARGARVGSVLELGAGSLNHLPFETNSSAYDCVEPFVGLYADSPHRHLVRTIYADIEEVPSNLRYERVLSVATLEHLEQLPRVLARCALLLAEGGVFQAAFPSEGGLLWGLSWRLTTAISYRLRTGLDYATVMRHEHVNTAIEIESIVGHLFGQTRVRRFPSPWRHLSFYTHVESRRPNLERCRALLNSGEGSAPCLSDPDPRNSIPAGE